MSGAPVFVRVVRLKLTPGSLWAFREYYESHIVPALQATEGCLLAALLRRAGRPEDQECDSLTLWESAADADAYVDSGLYDEMLDGADPYLAAATEWRADLAQPGSAQRPPLPDPEVETYPVEVALEPPPEEPAPLFLRLVDLRVEPSAFDELKRIYEEVVAPALLAEPGCRAAYLVEGLRGRAHAIAATFWEDEASAVRHETSGRFDELAANLRPVLSGIYQWRLSLAPESESRAVKGSDLDVRGFHVVTGRRLRQRGC